MTGLALAAGLALVLVASARAQDWALERVEGREAIWIDLVQDAAGNAFTAVSGNGLRLAKWDGASWLIEDVLPVGECTENVSIALDALGNPIISFNDLIHSDLRLARWTGTAWAIEVVDSGGDVGRYCSLALSATGQPSISYQDATNEDLKYARWTGTSWATETVDSVGSVGITTSLRLDAAGNAAISYYDATTDTLKYARWSGTVWTLEVVDAVGAMCQTTSLALDAAGEPVISYQDSVNYALKCARRTGGTWALEVVDAAPTFAGAQSSIELDVAGNPMIGYIHGGGAGIKVARWTGTAWTIESVLSGFNTGWVPSLELDATGLPSIAYLDAGNRDLALARSTGTAWDIQATDIATHIKQTAVAVDTGDNPVLIYTDRETDEVWFVRWAGGSKTTELALASGEGWFSSLALDSTGNPGFSFGSAVGGVNHLRYARKVGATWVTEVVDPTPRTGVASATSLAYDSADVPGISYYEEGVKDLRYARWTGTAWLPEVVDSTGWVGSGSSLAFDRARNPVISYFDGTNSTVKLARWNGTSWAIEVVDDINIDGGTRLALDSLDRPVIAYRASSSRDLLVARWTGAAWTIGRVDAAFAVHGFALDDADRPTLYYNSALVSWEGRLARWTGSSWSIETVAEGYQTGDGGSLALDSASSQVIGLASYDCDGYLDVHLVRRPEGVLFRWMASSLAPGWQSSVFPQTPGNDDETPPYPMRIRVGGAYREEISSSAPLVLYRLVRDDGEESGPVLRVFKSATVPGAVELMY